MGCQKRASVLSFSSDMTRFAAFFTLTFLLVARASQAQAPTPTLVEGPNVKVLTGLLAPAFQDEMNHLVEGLGVTCGTCHVRGNFASEDNPKKLVARRMLEMTKALNKQYFPDYTPKPEESVLGRITCYTCHQGDVKPKTAPGQ